MKATLILLAPASLLFVSCTKNFDEPVAPPLNPGDPYGVPTAQAPYQPVDPINPPATPAPVAVPAPVTPATPVTPPAPSPELNGNVYTIMAGDSLWGISRKFNTTVEAIKELNGLSSDTIVSGRTLIIPGR